MISRILIALAGLFGAAGVATAAAASHGGDTNLTIAANFLMFHAPALLALGLLAANRVAALAGLGLAAGVVVFAGDLAMRSRLGLPLFPMAAPLGGGMMILGWLGIAASALARPRA